MRDKEQMLRFMDQNPNYLVRENQIAHFTASIWTVNKERTKTLMVYHNIYDSWSWIGGHANELPPLTDPTKGRPHESWITLKKSIPRTLNPRFSGFFR